MNKLRKINQRNTLSSSKSVPRLSAAKTRVHKHCVTLFELYQNFIQSKAPLIEVKSFFYV